MARLYHRIPALRRPPTSVIRAWPGTARQPRSGAPSPSANFQGGSYVSTGREAGVANRPRRAGPASADPRGDESVDPQRMHRAFRLFILTYLVFWSWIQLVG